MSNSAFTQSSTLLKAIRAVLPTLAVAYLFGSASRDSMRRDSDVDVAVDVGRKLASTEQWDAAQALSLALGRDVDLVDFRAASDVLRHQILTTGRRIFVADVAAQDSYEAAVLSEYMDFIARRAPLMQDIRQRGTVYVG